VGIMSSTTMTAASSSNSIDPFANGGQIFQITIPIDGSLIKRSSIQSWLMVNGSITKDHSLAANFTINSNGELIANQVLGYSTDPPTVTFIGYQLFAAAEGDSVGPITTTFFSANASLHWVNQLFSPGSATFCIQPAIANNMPTMRVYFNSGANCSNIVFPGIALVGSPTVSPVYTIPQTYMSFSSRIPSSTSSISASPSSTTMAISQDGTCGPFSGFDMIDHTCLGFRGGQCCKFISQFLTGISFT
jgi:hypothetical protein